MSLLFFRHEGVWVEPDAAPRLTGWRWWLPDRDGWPPPGPMQAQNCVWWALDRLGAFARPGLAELTLAGDAPSPVRVLVTPRWYRFPFMAAADLQVGGLWTHPDARRQGLARAAMREALRGHARPGQRIWTLVDAGNIASVSLIRSLGYRLVGTGDRSAPGGIGAIGQFRLREPLCPVDGHGGDRS